MVWGWGLGGRGGGGPSRELLAAAAGREDRGVVRCPLVTLSRRSRGGIGV